MEGNQHQLRLSTLWNYGLPFVTWCALVTQAHIDKGNELKAEANALFAKKEFTKAVEVYQQAASSYPHDHAEKPQMLCNKAACYTMLKKCVRNF